MTCFFFCQERDRDRRQHEVMSNRGGGGGMDRDGPGVMGPGPRNMGMGGGGGGMGGGGSPVHTASLLYIASLVIKNSNVLLKEVLTFQYRVQNSKMILTLTFIHLF